MDPFRFGTEFVYTLLVVILCLLIYFQTKEIYSLSKYKGIKFFRSTFLFFALAYIFRFLILLFQLVVVNVNLHIPGRVLMPYSLLFTSYLSTMAIIFLIYSVIWKRLKIKNFVAWSNLVALGISIYSFLTHSHTALIIAQSVLLLGGLVITFFAYRKAKKLPKMFTVYLLIFFFWVLNLFSLGPKRFLSIEIIITSNVLSLVLFIIIYFKVRKWAC